MGADAKKADLSFEEIATRLESIADKLEAGDTKLEEALGLFEEGMKLSKLGTSRLDKAEQRIEQLLAGDKVADLDVGAAESSGSSEPDDLPF